MLGSLVPNGYYPIFSKANGDCLYNSTSIALHGTEKQTVKLFDLLHCAMLLITVIITLKWYKLLNLNTVSNVSQRCFNYS